MLDFLGMCLAVCLLVVLIFLVIVLFVVGYMLVKEDRANGKNLSGRLS